MTQTTLSADASSLPTKTFKVGDISEASGGAPVCKFYSFEQYSTPLPVVPAKHKTIGSRVSKFEQNEERRKAMEEARSWVADEFYSEDGDTVRTLRLRKGWSQSRLAEALSTSQPHIARIEKGTENLTIETCRKLCQALEIDFNTLDLALGQQERITHSKVKSK